MDKVLKKYHLFFTLSTAFASKMYQITPNKPRERMTSKAGYLSS